MKMKINKITIVTLILISLFVQIIIISYNFFTGYINISDFRNFLIRLSIGTSFSFIFSLLLIYLDLKFITILDKKLPLPDKLLARIPVELIFIILVGVFVGTLITTIAGYIMPYPEGLFKVIVNISLITAVLNLIIVAVIEAIVWFRRNQHSKILVERLEKENSIIRFETLKNQLNPHFLFNSLNFLSSLINKDPERAQKIIDKFSSVYRYTLDVIDRPVIELKEEIEFAKSYLYLQKIKFENTTEIEINIDASKLNFYVPPLAIQVLLDNAFKHNKASAESPLKIIIFNEGDVLVVTNNLQLKISNKLSKGVGLNNLNKRYQLLGNANPNYIVTETDFTAKIPLIPQG